MSPPIDTVTAGIYPPACPAVQVSATPSSQPPNFNIWKYEDILRFPIQQEHEAEQMGTLVCIYHL